MADMAKELVPRVSPYRVRNLGSDGRSACESAEGVVADVSCAGLVFTKGFVPFFGRGHDLVLYRDVNLQPRLVVCRACARYASKRWACL
eukprot:3742664-Amphidinium_carterae.1